MERNALIREAPRFTQFRRDLAVDHDRRAVSAIRCNESQEPLIRRSKID